eukprot:5979514-Pyramimonas_sp.AAC.1
MFAWSCGPRGSGLWGAQGLPGPRGSVLGFGCSKGSKGSRGPECSRGSRGSGALSVSQGFGVQSRGSGAPGAPRVPEAPS